MPGPAPDQELTRALGIPGASLLGLGSILGTGVFVSIGLAADVAGAAVIIAVAIAAIVATLNGLSSAQLAAVHPVSGGTYEYGHKFLAAPFGFAAGWLFLTAKSASAATAALGVSGYALHALEIEGHALHVGGAAGSVVLITALVVSGIRRSSRANAVIVGVTLCALIAFVVVALSAARGNGAIHLDLGDMKFRDVAGASALMFVAFAGYGRVATLGEEVREPRRTIPRAIVTTLVVSAIVYLAVAISAVAAVGAAALAQATGTSAAPLEMVAHAVGQPEVAQLVAVGAITAMLGVTLNLILGLSRVVLAMARRGDVPSRLAVVKDSSPVGAVLVVGALVTGLTFIGDIRQTWSLSAFAVLVYYAITNLSAIRVAEGRFIPRWVSVLGMLACLSLAVWVPPTTWIIGSATLAVGFVWRAAFRHLAPRQ